jgi:hypothetical protein
MFHVILQIVRRRTAVKGASYVITIIIAMFTIITITIFTNVIMIVVVVKQTGNIVRRK